MTIPWRFLVLSTVIAGLAVSPTFSPSHLQAGQEEFVGKKLEAFELPGLTGADGKQTMLSTADLKGQVILLSFWASWCGPCRRELPAYNEVYDELKSKGLEIVAINVDRKEADAKKFLDKIDSLKFPVVLDSHSKVMGRYDVVSMPTSFLIGRDGTIIHRETGFSDEKLVEMKKRIEEALASK